MKGFSISQLEQKPNPDKWSKKEIVGHLIDSGINNLQRFTEIQFSQQPFTIRRYNQVELVKVNAYQQAELSEIINCLLSINTRIIQVIEHMPEENMRLKIMVDTTVNDWIFSFTITSIIWSIT